MTIYSFYDSTGQIVTQKDILPAEVAGLTPPGGGSYLGKTDPKAEYFLAGVLTARPTMAAVALYEIAADGVDDVDFIPPTGTIISCMNYEHPTATTTAGEHFIYTSTIDRIDIFHFETPHPYLPMNVTIVAGVPDDRDDLDSGINDEERDV